MNIRIVFLFLLVTGTPLLAQQISFPAGNFESSPSTHWAKSVTGLLNSVTYPTSNGNTTAQISLVALGGGTFTSTVPASYLPNSLYEVSVSIANSNLLALGSAFGVEIRDGGGNIIASMNESQAVGLLGQNLDLVDSLTGNLNALSGSLTGEELLVGTLRDLLGSLGGNSDALSPIKELTLLLRGADETVLAGVMNVLADVLSGTLDPGSLSSPELAGLLNLAPGDLVGSLASLLAITEGNELVLANFLSVLEMLPADTSDLALIGDLLSSLFDEPNLITEVTNLLNLSLAENVLGELTSGETLALLGLLQANSSEFQTVKLLFTTGATAPQGNLSVRLRASATLAVALTVRFDNISIRRFDLVPTPVSGHGHSPGTGPGPSPGSDDGLDNGLRLRPLLSPYQSRVIRQVTGQTVKISGTAQALGEGNSIRTVLVSLKGKGVPPKARKFQPITGAERWVARLRVPVGAKTRVIFRAIDQYGLTSADHVVRVSRR